MPNCTDCGRPFTASKTGYTVKCPACRGKKITKKPSYKALTCGNCGHEYTSLNCDRCGKF